MRYSVLLLALMLLAGCGGGDDGNDAPAELPGRIVTNNNLGAIGYPDGWTAVAEINRMRLGNSADAAVVPLRLIQSGQVSVSVDVITESLSGFGINSDPALPLVLQAFTAAEMVELNPPEETTSGGMPAIRADGTLFVGAVAVDVLFVVVDTGTTYGFVSAISPPGELEPHFDTIMDIASTFEFLG